MKTTTHVVRLAALWALALCCACGGDALVPEIDEFSPKSGTVGTDIVIQGRNFDRDGRGYPMPSGSVAWQVYLLTADRRFELPIADITDHSMVVTVPEGVRSGTIGIADAAGLMTETAGRFEVVEYPSIRVVNDAQYDVVDLRLNGEQILVDSRVLESGAVLRVAVPTDRYRVDYGVGELKTPWVRGALHGVDVAELGTEVVVHIPALDPLDILTVGRAPTDWVAQLTDLAGRPTTITLRMYGDGAWALFEGAAPTQQGQVLTEPIGTYAHTATFRLSAAGAAAKIGPPFTSFDLDNGPSHWRLLHYVRQ